MLLTFSYFHYWGSKFKVETLFYMSNCRTGSALQNALFQFLFVSLPSIEIFVYFYSHFRKIDFYQNPSHIKTAPWKIFIISAV